MAQKDDERKLNCIVFLKNQIIIIQTWKNIEKDPKRLDTEIIRHGFKIEAKVYNKFKKLLVHWFSEIPTNYESHLLMDELHRVKG